MRTHYPRPHLCDFIGFFLLLLLQRVSRCAQIGPNTTIIFTKEKKNSFLSMETIKLFHFTLVTIFYSDTKIIEIGESNSYLIKHNQSTHKWTVKFWCPTENLHLGTSNNDRFLEKNSIIILFISKIKKYM